MKVLFVGAHTDEEICFAGAIQHYSNRFYVAFSTCGLPELSNEFRESCDILDINSVASTLTVRKFDRQAIADFLYDHQKKFDCLFTHSIDDVHPDHKIVAEESIRVWRKRLITYLAPWNGNEDPNYFIEITEQQLEKKILALKSYRSQSHRHYMNEDFIRSWARYNGGKIGKLYAEGFKLVRGIDFADICSVNRECERMNIAERLKL
jgi:N-acetylglucosamine malate deacetylase 1